MERSTRDDTHDATAAEGAGPTPPPPAASHRRPGRPLATTQAAHAAAAIAPENRLIIPADEAAPMLGMSKATLWRIIRDSHKTRYPLAYAACGKQPPPGKPGRRSWGLTPDQLQAVKQRLILKPTPPAGAPAPLAIPNHDGKQRLRRGWDAEE